MEDAAGALGVIAETAAPQHPAGGESEPTEPVTGDAYWDARELFRGAGVEFPDAQLVRTCAEAVAAADSVGYPVVLKAMGLLHKSDSGGVALGLETAQQLTDAFTRMDGSLAAPAYCVESMADLSAGVELIVGVQTDPRFGPVAMVGLGGIFTEVLADVAFALAPVDAETAVVCSTTCGRPLCSEGFAAGPRSTSTRPRTPSPPSRPWPPRTPRSRNSRSTRCSSLRRKPSDSTHASSSTHRTPTDTRKF